jgi:formylglycine-generating enzyme required for sulfatase activity
MRCAVLILACCLAAPSYAAERVRIDGFEIDRTEVTIARFAAFVEAAGMITTAEREGGGYEFAAGWTRRAGWTFRRPQGGTGGPDEPAVHVTWGEASRFCAQAGGRLPTAAEWRRAAYTELRDRPTDGFEKGRTYVFPVGDVPAGMNNNRRGHVPVGTTRLGVNGLYDMGANVWEWLSDRRGDEALTAGGSWWYGPEQSRAEAMQYKAVGFFAVYVGFRCAYDVRG